MAGGTKRDDFLCVSSLRRQDYPHKCCRRFTHLSHSRVASYAHAWKRKERDHGLWPGPVIVTSSHKHCCPPSSSVWTLNCLVNLHKNTKELRSTGTFERNYAPCLTSLGIWHHCFSPVFLTSGQWWTYKCLTLGSQEAGIREIWV